jgi:hypothetical protein
MWTKEQMLEKYNLPKRRCANCGTSYKPVRPLLEGELGFCKADCRKSYHKHGGAYRKLKTEVRKMVAAEMKTMEKRLREIVKEEIESRLKVYDLDSNELSVLMTTTREEDMAIRERIDSYYSQRLSASPAASALKSA